MRTIRQNNVSKKFYMLAGLAALSAMASQGKSAVISVSDTAPVGSLIANPMDPVNVGTQTGYIDYTDNGGNGTVGGNTVHGGTSETFTIPATGTTITSVTVQSTSSEGYGGATNFGNAVWSLNIAAMASGTNANQTYSTYDGGTSYIQTRLTSVDDELATGQGAIQADYSAGDKTEYITFTLASPLVLAGGSQTAYAFSIFAAPNAGGGNVYMGLGLNTNTYAGGVDGAVDINNGSSGQPAENLGYEELRQSTGSVDKVFFIGTAVPEPTSMSLLGVAGLGLLRRRRQV